MKKNKMMRVASALLIAVLLTTSAISGTFAKYTTQDAASDAARVAKWGVELQAVGNLYGKAYAAGTTNTIVANNASGATVQSNSSANDDVVAPGTKNDEGFTFSLKGIPEVSGKITSNLVIRDVFLAGGAYGQMIPVDNGVVTAGNFEQLKGGTATDDGLYYKDGDTYKKATEFTQGSAGFYTLEDYTGDTALTAYYPVVYTLTGGTAYSAGAVTASSLEEVADLIKAQLGMNKTSSIATDGKVTYSNTSGVEFAPNTDLAGSSSINLDDQKITWAWAFTGNDAADTILGLIENPTDGTVVKKTDAGFTALTEYTDYCIEADFNLTITVEQVD